MKRRLRFRIEGILDTSTEGLNMNGRSTRVYNLRSEIFIKTPV